MPLLNRDKPRSPIHAAPVEEPTPTGVARTLAANHDRFLRFLERRVGRRDLAEEILQDAFVRGLSRADSVQSSETAVAWFYRLLRNALVDHHRHHHSEQRALQAVAVEPVAAVPQPDEELMNTVCDCVGDMLSTLKPEYARAIRAVDMDGASVGDFAVDTGISAGNAAVRVHRARQALRRRLEESCGTCAEHACLDCQCQHEKPAAG
jgi:RNA polymerase sigma factor (sigma-70 family)